jgi:uncharacterized protein
VLGRLGINNSLYTPWQGVEQSPGDQHAKPASMKTAPLKNAPAAPPHFVDLALWDEAVMTLATAAPGTRPHAAAVYFAADAARQNLYFFSSPASRHSLDAAANPQASAAIQPPAPDWSQIRGLQLSGRITAVPTGPEWDTGWQIYQQKFPFVRELKSIVTENWLYTFQPDWIRQIDNSQGFGFKEEWTRP